MNVSKIRENLCRQARFGANISEAFGCYIFLPNSIFSAESKDNSLGLAGFHSQSNEVIHSTSIEIGGGLIGWVSRHKRSVHVSPFERDSRTLGFYYKDEGLKSFLAIPFETPFSKSIEAPAGVIVCDSQKAFAFTKAQGKLLEDLANEVSGLLELSASTRQSENHTVTWQTFCEQSRTLSSALGKESIEILRISIDKYSELENMLGNKKTIMFFEQIHRLIEQCLPPQTPNFKMPNGDLLITLDNMMSNFVENKILALGAHCIQNPLFNVSGKPSIDIKFQRCSLKQRKFRNSTLEDLLNSLTFAEQESAKLFEYKKAAN